MLNVGTPELLVILVVALLVLGPTRLPEVARQIGKAVGEVRRMSAGFQAEMRDAMQEPVKLEPAEPAEPEAPSDDAGDGVPGNDVPGHDVPGHDVPGDEPPEPGTEPT